MKGSRIKDLCLGVAWKASPKHGCCSFGSRYSGTYCLFNLGLPFLEFYAVKNGPWFLLYACKILLKSTGPFNFLY